ncbi:hypothetical protein JEQ12_009704 [Ovis aries]|uniref:Uncharacterized protein n=1 Tax=Ovis aries TaxID=9940 RepID=A0A836AN29_SHEEP|nr:hypothetical protein JEQ12_009704 [Ovis aries]
MPGGYDDVNPIKSHVSVEALSHRENEKQLLHRIEILIVICIDYNKEKVIFFCTGECLLDLDLDFDLDREWDSECLETLDGLRDPDLLSDFTRAGVRVGDFD